MNYLQMYINLSVILGLLTGIFLMAWVIACDTKTAKRSTKMTLGITSSVLIALTLFCAAMAGLLS